MTSSFSLPDPFSYWVQSSPRTPNAPLTSDTSADVCVIGGGIVGAVTAHLLHAEGQRVVLIDAREIGRGVTGHTTAKITSSHGLIYRQLERSFGAEGAAVYGAANEAGKEKIASLVEELGIDCGFERQDNYVYTEERSYLGKIKEEVEAARRAGLPASFVTSSPLPYSIEGAVRFTNQAQFHPRRFVLGLLDRAESDGVVIHEGTTATKVSAGETCRIETSSGGRVDAAAVVVATHLPFLDRGFFFAKAHPHRSYVVASYMDQPPDGMHISTGGATRSIRHVPHGDRRLLLVSGEGHKTGQKADTEEPYQKLARFAEERFGLSEFAYRWAAHDYVSVDHVPYVGRLTRGSDNILVATGFGKWGFANGAAAAMIMTDQIVGRRNEWMSLFDAKRLDLLAAAPEFIKENGQVALHFVGDRLDRRSPRCTHMGCALKWNNAESTWDCPCHGSRFDAGGKVIEGPATSDLDPASLPARS
ncbi:MAG TPA: FAD-dependent oxidoreductase [Actinomycetota bacterium]|nr:FAD-dependent oxidoreductase [Actinomycetota bacterium]